MNRRGLNAQLGSNLFVALFGVWAVLGLPVAYQAARADDAPPPVINSDQASLSDEVSVAGDSVLLEASEEPAPMSLPVELDQYNESMAADLQAATDDALAHLANGTPNGLSVLVYLEPARDVGGAAAGPARLGVRQFAAQRNREVRYEYEILPNVINIRGVTQEDVADLRALPGVVRVEEDQIYQISLHDSIPLINGLESQKAAAGISARGTGVRVCIIDTGINASHVMFSGRIDAAADYDHYNNDTNPADDHGHGSNVAGIAAGGDGFTVNFGTCGVEPLQGVAPGATIIAMKVCSATGSCPTSDIVAGINDCASTALPGGQADVINLSLGGGQFTGTCDSDASAAAANNAVAAGVTVVAAAGNNGFSNALGSPACGSQVIPVGAVYDSNFPNCQDPDTSFGWCLNSSCTSTCTDSAPVNADERACFSNRSVNLELTAPGALIWSAGISSSTSLIEMPGTSQASPHVAGLAALLLGEDPSLTPAQVLQLMRDGAVDLGATGFDNDFGWGRIDVINSLNLIGPGCTTNADCNDGLFCNGLETCVADSCQAGIAPNCSDAVACTTDSCNEATDSCNHTPNNAACDDGLFCNGAETCNATLGCQAGSDPCGGQPCNETTNTCGAGVEVWLSFTDAATVPVVGAVQDEDIVAYNTASGAWSLIFDGSDVGLSGAVIDGMARTAAGDILLSFTVSLTIPGMTGGPGGSTTLDDSDIVRFIPTSLGSTTAGSFVFYFDASDVGLSTNSEDVDAIALTSTGQLVLSTLGTFSATGASGEDEDLILFSGTLGAATSGSFSMYFDGSDVGLSTTSDEDVDAAGLTSTGTILLSTLGNFSVPGVSGADEDILQFAPTSLGPTTSGTYSLFLALSAVGIDPSEDVGSVELVE